MALYFKNPSNNYIQKTTHHGLWSLFFGGFYYGYHGVWIHCLAFLLLGPLAWLVYPFFARDIIKTAALKNGLIQIAEIEAKEAGINIDPEDTKAIIAGSIMGVSLVIILISISVFLSKGYGYSESRYSSKNDAEAAIAALEAMATAQAIADLNDAEAAIAALEAMATAQAIADAKAATDPYNVQLDSPELSKFQQSYYQLEKELVVYMVNSRKVMRASVAIMTHYDERVVSNVEKHIFELRMAMLTVMSHQTEQSIVDPDFRRLIAEELKLVMNATLEQLEDFGGIEDVYLTGFVVE